VCCGVDALNGLTQSVNEFILRDRSGFAWISSTDGLNRFDGLHIKPYRSGNNPGDMKGNNVLSRVFEDDQRNLWFATEKCLNRYNRLKDNFSHFSASFISS